MKTFLRALRGCSVYLLTVQALFSQQMRPKTEPPINHDESRLAIPGYCPVLGEPYSAAWEMENIQTLADGTRIDRKWIEGKSYRDSAGRTRSERYISTAQYSDPPITLLSVSILDPVAGVSYRLDPRNHTAVQGPDHVDPRCNQIAPSPSSSALRPQEGRVFVQPSSPNSSNPCANLHGQITDEDLGTQVVNGLLAHGTRKIMTIPTCAQGNDRPIKVVTDQWLSDELKVYVLTTRLDPRTADLVGRLTQLDRSEPELSLFQVPSDYTFTQAPKLPLKLVIH